MIMKITMIGQRRIDMNKTIDIERSCPFCGVTQKVTVDKKQYEKYRQGALAQNAFPNLSPTEREIIITGICSRCWPS